MFAFKNIFLQMKNREVDITKGTNHFITGAEGGLVFFLRQKTYVKVSLKKIFYFALCKKKISV
jgi:hypothetical protein